MKREIHRNIIFSDDMICVKNKRGLSLWMVYMTVKQLELKAYAMGMALDCVRYTYLL